MLSLVPMAGRGSRFVSDGYRLPKPFIPIMGQSMFVAALNSFPPADRFIFLCRTEFLQRFPFERELKKYFPNSLTLSVGSVTEGQACTCLLAEQHMDMNEALIISSIDYQIIYDEHALATMLGDGSIDVIIFTFQAGSISLKAPEAFAYCRTEGDRVLEVVEKRTISDTPALDPAVVGTFYYREAHLFVRGAKQMIERNIRVNGEFYVGTSINQLIEQGCNVRMFPVAKFISFGDPMELQLYQAWEDYFYHEPSHPYGGWR